MKDRDLTILKKMIRYADEIEWTIEKMNLDFEMFESDFIAKNAIAMCILQIGELVGKLTEETKKKYNKMPWKDIRSIRNIAAHNYGELDNEVLWETVTDDIPKLKDYCENILSENNN